MLRNFSLFRCNDPRPTAEIAEANPFLACAPTQASSVGYRDEHTVIVERKAVPAEAVKRHAEEAARKVERETGRKPGRKAMRELKEQALHELLPQAFARRKAIPLIWLDGLLVVGSTSASDLDAVTTWLTRTVDGLVLANVQTREAPAGLLRDMVRDPTGFYPICAGRAVLLAGENGLKVRYKNYPLDSENVLAHITAGREVESLDMEWTDRMAWTLTRDLQFKGAELLAVIHEGADPGPDVVAAERELWRGALKQVTTMLLDDLLGGAMELPE